VWAQRRLRDLQAIVPTAIIGLAVHVVAHGFLMWRGAELQQQSSHSGAPGGRLNHEATRLAGVAPTASAALVCAVLWLGFCFSFVPWALGLCLSAVN